MTKKVAILQSNYIPWKGYFDLIGIVDEFILYDDAQYTRRDWRNRNRIKTPDGLQWLTIPVDVKGKYFQSIKDTKVAATDWCSKHMKSIRYNYSNSRFFTDYLDLLNNLFKESSKKKFLSEINFIFIRAICNILNIKTKLSWSMDYSLNSNDNTEKLIELSKQSDATDYMTGPSAKSYLNVELFEKEDIKVTWMDYSGYPEYNQLFPPFEHQVSIVDLIFNTGDDSYKYMKSFEKTK